MALLSVIVRQAQFSGDKNTTSQYCTYVTLTLDRCRTKTVIMKGQNPHWEQDYLFETQRTSRGLLIEVWKQDEYLHTLIGCYWLPLNTVRYSNEHTTGLWASLGRELFVEDGLIVKSINATGHFLLYDARFEVPEDRRVGHHNSENIVEDHYSTSVCRRTVESISNNSTPASASGEHSDEWCRYDNYQDGYRSSSSENMRSDLDYSYSETSNQVDHHSCYESSEKSLEKETRYSHEYRSTSYYGDSSYEQSEVYNDRSKSYNKPPDYEDQGEDEEEQWVSDEYPDEETDEIIYENDQDYGLEDDYGYSIHHQKSSPFNHKEIKTCYNNGSNFEDDQDTYSAEEEDDDNEYYDHNNFDYVQPATSKKRILPSIPSYESRREHSYQNSYMHDQYKEKNLPNGYPRVPSIYVDSPTLSPCLPTKKNTFEYKDQHSDDSASMYQYSDNSTIAQSNHRTYSNNHCTTNTGREYVHSNFVSKIDGYASNEEEGECDDSYAYDYYDYDDDVKSDDNQEVANRRNDDINNNQLMSSRGVLDYAKRLCLSFRDKEEMTTTDEKYERNRRKVFQKVNKTAEFTKQSKNSFSEQFEWTFNEIPEDEYDTYEHGHSPDHISQKEQTITKGRVSKSDINNFFKPISSVVEEEDYIDEDDVTLVSPVNSSSLSPRSMNYQSQDKEITDGYGRNTIVSPYREEVTKLSPVSDNISQVPEGYRSPYSKSSITELPGELQPENLVIHKNEQDEYVKKLDIISPEPRKASLKDENSIEMRRQLARNRWHTAYEKIIHQLNFPPATNNA